MPRMSMVEAIRDALDVMMARDKSVVEITVREGRNDQVRRVLARLGHKVRDLTRVRMGPLTLEGVGPGRYRPLTGQEVRALRALGERKAEEVQPPQHPRQTPFFSPAAAIFPCAAHPEVVASAPRCETRRAGLSLLMSWWMVRACGSAPWTR